MARMLDLRDILELINEGLDHRASAEHQPVMQRQQSLFHLAFEIRDQLNACGLEQLLR